MTEILALLFYPDGSLAKTETLEIGNLSTAKMTEYKATIYTLLTIAKGWENQFTLVVDMKRERELYYRGFHAYLFPPKSFTCPLQFVVNLKGPELKDGLRAKNVVKGYPQLGRPKYTGYKSVKEMMEDKIAGVYSYDID